MNLLNFKFFKKSAKSQTVITRQDRKAAAREARAERLKRRLTGKTWIPFMGSGKPIDTSVRTRQTMRLKLRTDAFNDLTRKFPGEPRKVRRAMARDLAKRQFGQMRKAV